MPRNKSERLTICPKAIAYAELIESGERHSGVTHATWDAMPHHVKDRLWVLRTQLIQAEGGGQLGRERSLIANARFIRENYRDPDAP